MEEGPEPRAVSRTGCWPLAGARIPLTLGGVVQGRAPCGQCKACGVGCLPGGSWGSAQSLAAPGSALGPAGSRMPLVF